MAAAVYALLRNGFVLAGILLLGIGLGDLVGGGIKRAQYVQIVRSEPAVAPRNPAALFPTATESQERTAIARTKLGYYQVMATAGRILCALGLSLLALGVLQVRRRTRPPWHVSH